MRFASLLVAAAALLGCTETAAPPAVSEPDPAQAADAHKGTAVIKAGAWDMVDGAFDTLVFQEGDTKITLRCEEAKRSLVITASPGTPAPLTSDAAATITIGAQSFPATVKAGPLTNQALTVTLPANADTVTALMMGDNIGLKIAAPALERVGKSTVNGVFDLFGTTCKQVNGL